MNQILEIEKRVINIFVEQNKRERFLSLIEKPLSRKKFIKGLDHPNFLIEDLFERVSNNEEERILNALSKIKLLNNTCYIISSNPCLEKKTLDIKSALSQTIGYGFGTILVFGKGEMLFYETDNLKERYLSKFVPF